MAEEKVVYPKFSTEEPEPEQPVKFTEDFQTKAFVDNHDGNLRYVEKLDKWFFYNGNYWEEISTLTVTNAARLMNRGTAVALDAKHLKLKTKLSTRVFAKSVEVLSRGDERCLLEVEELDKDPWLLGTPGGIYDLKTGLRINMGLKPYVTMITACEPVDAANESTCPQFLKFMEEFTCGDAELKRFLLQYAGYCLTGDMREQCLIFLHGDGDNGKSVFIQVLRGLLGGYATTAAIELFVTAGASRHLAGFAALHRKRCIITNETQKSHTLRMDVIKTITGQDLITANFMRQNPIEFRPVGKLVMFGNHKPSLPNVGKAEKKRIRMIPCELRLEPHEIDRDLGQKLLEEGPGILRAFMDGCLDWQRNGLIVPKCVKEHTENYFYTQNQFDKWLAACCVVGKDKQEATTILWKSWQIWSKGNGVEVGTETAFAESLDEAGFKYDKNLKGAGGKCFRGWRGLEVATDANTEPEMPL